MVSPWPNINFRVSSVKLEQTGPVGVRGHGAGIAMNLQALHMYQRSLRNVSN